METKEKWDVENKISLSLSPVYASSVLGRKWARGRERGRYDTHIVIDDEPHYHDGMHWRVIVYDLIIESIEAMQEWSKPCLQKREREGYSGDVYMLGCKWGVEREEDTILVLVIDDDYHYHGSIHWRVMEQDLMLELIQSIQEGSKWSLQKGEREISIAMKERERKIWYSYSDRRLVSLGWQYVLKSNSLWSGIGMEPIDWRMIETMLARKRERERNRMLYHIPVIFRKWWNCKFCSL